MARTMGYFPDIVGDDVDTLLEALQGDDDEGGGKKNARDLPIGVAGLTPTSIGAAASATISAPVNCALRPDRIVLGSAARVALSRVTQIAVGTVNLLVGSQAIPCDCFSPDAVGTRLKAAVTATPSVPPTITFSNGTAGAIVYEGAIFGPVLRV